MYSTQINAAPSLRMSSHICRNGVVATLLGHVPYPERQLANGNQSIPSSLSPLLGCDLFAEVAALQDMADSSFVFQGVSTLAPAVPGGMDTEIRWC